MKMQVSHSAEHVSEAHPDKFCDQVGDRILDGVLYLAGHDNEAPWPMGLVSYNLEG